MAVTLTATSARPGGRTARIAVRDRVALITGASSGSGAALARAFVADGVRDVLQARSAARLAALAEHLGASR